VCNTVTVCTFMYIVCTLYVHFLYTVCALYVLCMYIRCVVYIVSEVYERNTLLSIYIVWKLFVHCMYTVCTVHLHYANSMSHGYIIQQVLGGGGGYLLIRNYVNLGTN